MREIERERSRKRTNMEADWNLNKESNRERERQNRKCKREGERGECKTVGNIEEVWDFGRKITNELCGSYELWDIWK